jgi:twitching motility protein PilI
MSKRDALRAFQSHLASRLQDARESGVAASWLAIESGRANFLLPLGYAGEIFPWAETQPVPYTQDWFLGVSNLRGGLYGVVDLAGYLSGAAVSPRSDQARAQCRLVTFNEVLEVNCALLVDRLVGLRGVEAFASSSPPAGGAPAHHGSLYVDHAGVPWQEINLQLLAQYPEFLSISA